MIDVKPLPAQWSVPTLDLHALPALTEQAVHELLREGESLNTRLSYRSALRYWAAWFQLRYGTAITLPLPVHCVKQFVVDHAERLTEQGLRHELPAAIDQALVEAGFKGKTGPMALNTLVHRVAVLSKAHQLRQLSNPCQDEQLKELLSKTRKAYVKRGQVPAKKDALTKDPLLALLQTCDDSLKGLRDRALLLFAWSSGGRRRSEVSAADMKFLKRDGPAAFTYTLLHSKTNQSGRELPENFKPVHGIAGEALQAWLAASGITTGAVFRAVRKGGHLGAPLSPAAVRDIVRQRCVLAGVEGDFSAHSLRSGFVTEALRQSTPLAETMGMTGHRSVATLLGYSRLSTPSTQVVTLLDSPG